MNLMSRTHEEADTLIILRAFDVSKRDPFNQLYISCYDTDVFLLLIHFYDKLCCNTIFRTTFRDIDVGKAYHALGSIRSSALFGFHSFTGCDQTGRFNGYTKLPCWQTFFKSELEVLEAFQLLGDGSS